MSVPLFIRVQESLSNSRHQKLGSQKLPIEYIPLNALFQNHKTFLTKTFKNFNFMPTNCYFIRFQIVEQTTQL